MKKKLKKIDALRIRKIKLVEDGQGKKIICQIGEMIVFELDGPINPDSTYAVEKLLSEQSKNLCVAENGRPIASWIFLSSGGGLLKDGYKLGEIFRKYNVTTFVVGNAKCASSCAIAFLGGVFRVMTDNAQLTFHAPYLTDGRVIDCSDRGQLDGLKVYYKKYISDNKGAEFLYNRSMNYCSGQEGWTLNKDAAKLFGIVNQTTL